MKYNFDEIIDRKGTDAVKIEYLKTLWGREDLLPLWVADMDFRTPPFVFDAIRKRMEHEILGYTVYPKEWYASIRQWLQKKHGLEISENSIGFVAGVVPGIALAVKCFSQKGDKVMIQPPVYPPFFSVPERNERRLIFNPLILENGQYRMDFEKMRKEIKGCRLLILCSPHNPGGRVWNREELATLADICFENKVMVISDEIHADLTFSPFRHTCFSTVSEKASSNSITFMSPSKAFNMPGLATSYFISENQDIFSKFDNYLDSSGLSEGNIFAFIGLIAAYREGEEWLNQMLSYVLANVDFMETYLKERIPQIKMIRPQASFLVWLDCRDLNLSQKELTAVFVEKASLALNDGISFGEKEGMGFMRMNVACPKAVLKQALQQLESALKNRE